MVFRWKVLSLIVGIVFLLNMGIYLASRYTLFDGYLDIEKRLAFAHLERARNILQDDLDSLVSLNVDWSAWDDTYEFVSTRNSDYIESNLVSSTFEELDLNAIALLDTNNRIVYSGGYDRVEEVTTPLPEGLSEHLIKTSPLLGLSDPESRLSGIVSLPGGPFLVSSCPIISSEMSGPVKGIFILGRFLDEVQLERLSSQLQLPVSLLLAGGQAEQTSLNYLNEDLMKGVVAFSDLYGQPAFKLNLQIPRDISLQGRSTLNLFFVSGLLITLVSALIVYLIVDRWLINREERIESEERFRLMFVHSEAGMCSVQKSGKIQQVNSAFCRIVGHPEGEVVGMDLGELVSPIDRAWIASFFSFGRSSLGISGSFECRLIHQDGKTIWSKISIGWINRQQANSQYAILMVQDLSERKKVEDQLKTAVKDAQDAQGRARAILKSASDGLLLVDSELKIKMTNPAAEELLGLSSHEITHRPVETIIKSDCLMKLLKKIQVGETMGKGCDVVIPGRGAADEKHVRFYASPVISQKGKRESIILSLHDRTIDFELDQLKNDFIVTAAHEIRNPLTAVKGFSELLLGERAINHQDRQKYIGYIYEKSQALDSIVGELLNMERIASGRKIEIKQAQHDLRSFLEKIVAQYEMSWTDHQFYVDLPAQELSLALDAKKIEQVVTNLLNNAVKYSPVGGRIWAKGELLENEVRICIEDQGIGMTADELENVFEKFYRSRSSAELAEGVGLGLTISKEIVEAHGGRIWLNSVYGEGTRVYFSLPLERV